jgi:hypothetical protein
MPGSALHDHCSSAPRGSSPARSTSTVVDNSGHEITINPWDPGYPEEGAPRTTIDHSPLTSVACPSAAQCTALARSGLLLLVHVIGPTAAFPQLVPGAAKPQRASTHQAAGDASAGAGVNRRAPALQAEPVVETRAVVADSERRRCAIDVPHRNGEEILVGARSSRRRNTAAFVLSRRRPSARLRAYRDARRRRCAGTGLDLPRVNRSPPSEPGAVRSLSARGAPLPVCSMPA